MGSIDYIFELQTENTSLIQSTNYKDRIKKIKSHIDSLGISRTHVSIADERNHLIAFAVFEI